MIDPSLEQVFPLTQAPKRFTTELHRARGPHSRKLDAEVDDLKRIHVATWYRWSTRGCRGVVLETLQCGATRCTSLEAISRFFAALTAARTGSSPPAILPTPSHRRRAVERAGKELASLGL